MNVPTLKEQMLKEYGPIMSGDELYRSLGFRTWASFGRAVRLGQVEVRLFEIPNRKGKFATTEDVAEWVAKVAGSK